jgi:tetratricopeptide (TPR) repeat protein
MKGSCPQAQDLAAYVDRTLSEAERRSIERHLADCADCRDVVADTAAYVGEPAASVDAQRSRVRGRRLAVAAGAALAAAAAVLIVVRTTRSGVAPSLSPGVPTLVAAVSKEPTRLVEGRLAGFPYAPAPSLTRGVTDRGASRVRASAEVQIAAAAIEKHARAEAAPDQRADLGVALLTVGELDRAVDQLAGAAGSSPDAEVFNNLSVAYLTRAMMSGRRDDLPLALAAVNRALEIQPASDTALFNKALILSAMNRPAEAQAAADDYLRRDPSSAWAAELRARIR